MKPARLHRMSQDHIKTFLLWGKQSACVIGGSLAVCLNSQRVCSRLEGAIQGSGSYCSRRRAIFGAPGALPDFLCHTVEFPPASKRSLRHDCRRSCLTRSASDYPLGLFMHCMTFFLDQDHALASARTCVCVSLLSDVLQRGGPHASHDAVHCHVHKYKMWLYEIQGHLLW